MGESLKLAIWAIGTGLLRRIVKNDTLAQFLRLSIAQQRFLLESLARQNQRPSSGAAPSVKIHSSWRYRWQGIRQHFQLPCNYQTRKARSEWIEQRVSSDSRILVLGDDDYLSVELSGRGFRSVEVADCDAGILESIKEQTRSNRFQPSCFQGDFRDKTFLNQRTPQVICIDPPYNLKWASVFVDQAIRAAGDTQGVAIMFMVNQKCFDFVALEEIWQQFEDAGFDLKQSVEGFNTYPLHGLSGMFLKLAIHLLTEEKVSGPLVFTSDLLVFERRQAFESKASREASSYAGDYVHHGERAPRVV